MQESSKTVKVLCGRKRHSITAIGLKTLLLVNHRSLDVEKAYIAVGGEVCRCLKIKQAWEDNDWDALPAELAEFKREFILSEIDERISALEKEKSKITNKIQLKKETEKYLLYTLRHCKYPLSSFVKSIDVSLTDDPWFITGADNIKVQSIDVEPSDLYGQQCIVLIDNLPNEWLESVHKKGYSLIDGHLIVGTATTPTHNFFIWALKCDENKGYTIEKATTINSKLIWI